MTMCKMQCYSFMLFLSLSLTKFAFAASNNQTGIPKKEPSVNCTEYFADFDDRLDAEQLLGVWYQVTERTDQVYCLDFEKLTAESRNNIAAELTPYWNESNFDRYSMVVKRKCPGKFFNRTDMHLLAPLGDKGVFDTLFVPPNRSMTPSEYVWNPILIKSFEMKGRNYIGILSCFHLKNDEDPVILEREKKQNYSQKDIKDFHFVFNNNKIVKHNNLF